MAAKPQNLSKMISAQLRTKANEFINSRKHANNLVEILHMFEAETDNYTPLLLTIEVIFSEVLRRGDLVQKIVPLKPEESSPEVEYVKWLHNCYEVALNRCLELITQGRMSSRLQALVTACKLMQAEGCHPLEASSGYYFPSLRLKNIFKVLLNSEQSMTAILVRFQEFTEYRDVQQSPTPIYMQNYLELLDKLLICEIDVNKVKEKGDIEKEELLLCGVNDKAPFPYNPAVCKRYANKCWAFACQWALCSCSRTHRRALLLLVERMMPLLNKPRLATDMLCDSLDAVACQWALCSCSRTHRRALLLLVERMMPLLNKPRLATDMLCDSLDAVACQWALCSCSRTHRRALLLLVERMMPLLNKPRLATDMLCDSLDAVACQRALCSCSRTHRRALLLLVERLMPLLNKPRLATDMLCDSLDAELVRRHNISYPDMYDRLYAMFEPEMFATRYKRRLMHIADVFLSSTWTSQYLVRPAVRHVRAGDVRHALQASPYAHRRRLPELHLDVTISRTTGCTPCSSRRCSPRATSVALCTSQTSSRAPPGRHNISYDRLYAMFATRYKRRLMHIAHVFLSS
ncbi:Nucleolar complex protein 4-like protein B, partial [Operophtera brumata]